MVEKHSTYHLNLVIRTLTSNRTHAVLLMLQSRNNETSFIPTRNAYPVFLKNVSAMKDKEMMQNFFR